MQTVRSFGHEMSRLFTGRSPSFYRCCLNSYATVVGEIVYSDHNGCIAFRILVTCTLMDEIWLSQEFTYLHEICLVKLIS